MSAEFCCGFHCTCFQEFPLGQELCQADSLVLDLGARLLVQQRLVLTIQTKPFTG